MHHSALPPLSVSPPLSFRYKRLRGMSVVPPASDTPHLSTRLKTKPLSKESLFSHPPKALLGRAIWPSPRRSSRPTFPRSSLSRQASAATASHVTMALVPKKSGRAMHQCALAPLSLFSLHISYSENVCAGVDLIHFVPMLPGPTT